MERTKRFGNLNPKQLDLPNNTEFLNIFVRYQINKIVKR